MAKLPLYTQRYASGARRASARDFDGSSQYLGKAMSGLGDELNKLAVTLNAVEDKKAQDKAEELKSQAVIDLTEAYQQQKLDANPDGTGFSDTVDEGVKNYFGNLYENNDERVNKYLKKYEAGLRQHFVANRALPDQSAMYGDHVKNVEEQLANDEINLVRADPSQLPVILNSSLTRIQNNTQVNEATRQEWAQDHKSNLYYSAAISMIDNAQTERQAKEIQKDLKDDKWRNNVTPKQYTALINAADAQINAARRLEKQREAEYKTGQVHNMTLDWVDLMVKKQQGRLNPVEAEEFRAKYQSLDQHAPKYLQLIRQDPEIARTMQNVAEVSENLMNGTKMDQFDSQDLDKAADYYEAISSKLIEMEPEQRRATEIQLMKQLNVVFPQVEKAIRIGANSPDPAERVNSASYIAQIQSAMPTMPLSAKFSESQVSNAYDLIAYTDAGYSDVEAVAHQNEMLNVTENVRKTRKDYATELYDDDDTNVVKDMLFNAYDGWGFDPDIPPEMVAEGKMLAVNEYIKHGNEESVKKIVPKLLQKHWMRSEVGKGGDWMKYAPEKFYGIFGDERDAEWMQEQLDHTISNVPSVSKLFDLIPPDDRDGYDLVYNRYTQQKGTGNPTYFIRLWNKDGTYIAHPEPFYFDHNQSWMAKDMTTKMTTEYNEMVKEEAQKAQELREKRLKQMPANERRARTRQRER